MDCICVLPDMGSNPYCPHCYASELAELVEDESE